MTTPRGEDRPVELGGVPSEEAVSAADAAERLQEDPDDISRNQEQRPEVDLADDE
ncbi:hypothetical protein [Nocardioides dongkuii]|uniref:hypothetical protein n=1 Tax=Nocardioides dongkuii TaxID=2760089 RepID=UPI0015FA08A8|nr:hypothetical protein [Nocardioides dongkuii]